MAKDTVKVTGNVPVSNSIAADALAKNAGLAPVDDYSDETDIGGSLDVVLSQNRAEEMSLELRELLGQIQEGFGDLTKPSDIMAMDQPFYVVGAVTISDYLEQSTGELKVKHIFRLEFEGGIVKSMMQSAARPRDVLARAFTVMRGLGGTLRVGPYKLAEKKTKQIQPALIFVQQPGFKQAVANR